MSIDEAIAWAQKQEYQVERYGGEEARLIIIGESHGNKTHREGQLELVRQVQPGFILHEYGRCFTYDPCTERFGMLPKRKNRYEIAQEEFNDHMLTLAQEANAPLIGCDLSQAEIDDLGPQLARDHPSVFSYNHRSGILHRKIPHQDQNTLMDPYIMPHRERCMGNVCADHVRKTNKPTIAILGNYHTRSNSLIHPVLRDQGIHYIVLRQDPVDLPDAD